MTENLQNRINIASTHQSDVYEHINTLLKYSEECQTIVEMGMRGICTTWAFLGGLPKKLTSYDIQHPSIWGGNIEEVYSIAQENGIEFNFIQANVLDIDIEQTDMLFIDTWHSYNQLSQELDRHSENVMKYIIMHDTTSFGFRDETTYESWGWKGNNMGLWPAIKEFIQVHPEWNIHEIYTNNNGLTILKRI